MGSSLMKVSRRTAAAAIVTCALTAASVASASAGSAPGVATFDPVACAADGGSMTVDPGTEVTMSYSWRAAVRGLVMDFRNNQTTTLTYGAQQVDLSNTWSLPLRADDGSWFTAGYYDTGVTLQAGDSVTFTFAIDLRHVQPTGFTHGNPHPITPVLASCTLSVPDAPNL